MLCRHLLRSLLSDYHVLCVGGLPVKSRYIGYLKGKSLRVYR